MNSKKHTFMSIKSIVAIEKEYKAVHIVSQGISQRCQSGLINT